MSTHATSSLRLTLGFGGKENVKRLRTLNLTISHCWRRKTAAAHANMIPKTDPDTTSRRAVSCCAAGFQRAPPLAMHYHLCSPPPAPVPATSFVVKVTDTSMDDWQQHRGRPSEGSGYL